MTGFGGRVPAGLLSEKTIDVIVNVRIDIQYCTCTVYIDPLLVFAL